MTAAIGEALLDLEATGSINQSGLPLSGTATMELVAANTVTEGLLGEAVQGQADVVLALTANPSVWPDAFGVASLVFGQPDTSYLFEGWGIGL